MMTDPTPPYVGPHEGRELELMRAGSKPASMFLEPVDSDTEYFPEEEFDALVAEGKIVKYEALEEFPRHYVMRRVIYTLPGEEWRANALRFTLRLYQNSSPGWHPDLERMIGLLLGYERANIESFLARIAERHGLEFQSDALAQSRECAAVASDPSAAPFSAVRMDLTYMTKK